MRNGQCLGEQNLQPFKGPIAVRNLQGVVNFSVPQSAVCTDNTVTK